MRKYNINEKIFLDETSLSFYLLGVYMTDGSIYSTKKYNEIRINSKDKNWLELIKLEISPNKPIYKRKSQELYELKICSKEIINWLQSYGCVPNKSKTLEILKTIPPQFVKHFILGVFDGDGSVSTSHYTKTKNNKQYNYIKTNAYICSGSEQFIHQLNKYIPINITRSIVKIAAKTSMIQSTGQIIKGGPVWRIHFNDSQAKKFLEWIYDSNIQICLPRKQALSFNILGRQ